MHWKKLRSVQFKVNMYICDRLVIKRTQRNSQYPLCLKFEKGLKKKCSILDANVS